MKKLHLNVTNRWQRVTQKNLDAFSALCGASAGCVWHTPPREHGQIVETSYAFMDEAPVLVRRTRDRSDGRIEFAFRMARSSDEPWNTSPR